jgi:hypothetical protein
MFLTATNLFAYLNDLGIASCENVIEEDFLVVELGRRNRNFLVLRSKSTSLFVKQVPLMHPETIYSFVREAACMRLAREVSQKPVLNALCPSLRFYDDTRHVLIYDMLRDAETLAFAVAREPASIPALMHQLARTIAAVHLETSAHGSLVEIGPAMSGVAPWVLSIGENAESVMPNMSPAQRDLVQNIRQSRTLYYGLAALNVSWQRKCLVHGDLKWDNIMLLPTESGRELRLIDWELADVGEPLWDLAQITVGLLQYWLLNVPGDRIDESFSSPLPSASVDLSSLGVVFRDMWAAYFAGATGLHPDRNAGYALTARLVGARLVLLAFELVPKVQAITAHCRLAMRLAEYFFIDPAGAAHSLLGISGSHEMQSIAAMRISEAESSPWEVRA